MQVIQPPFRGRGASGNPPNRFEMLWYEDDPNQNGPEVPKTYFFKDPSRSIISTNESPDVGFKASINPYRGCEHGCVYCYARPTHEYLNFSAGLDFETKIMIKETAPELLRRELTSPQWTPQVLAMSGVTDPYQPVERRLGLTRKCLEVLAEFINPVVIVTKNSLVTRDLDLLGELARHNAAAVYLSITTLDGELARLMEPRASQPFRRLQAIQSLRQAGIPVGVMIAPVIPALTDHEMPAILKAAAGAGAQTAGYVVLRLPHGVKDLFIHWMAQHYPEKKEKVINRIRPIRSGNLNDSTFQRRMKGRGIFAEQISSLFSLSCRRWGIQGSLPDLSTTSFKRPQEGQLSLFPS